MSITSKDVEQFCERFKESETVYGGGPHNIIISCKSGHLEATFTGAQFHGCYILLGRLSRVDIVNGICEFYNLPRKNK